MADIGHNSGEPVDDLLGGVAADELRLLIERVENLQEERKGINDDIKDVLGEAKARGYDGKAMRTILQLRKLDRETRQHQQAMVDLYTSALGMD